MRPDPLPGDDRAADADRDPRNLGEALGPFYRRGPDPGERFPQVAPGDRLREARPISRVSAAAARRAGRASLTQVPVAATLSSTARRVIRPAALRPMDYKATLNLPTTALPMRANLPQREPELVRRWDALDLYGKLRERGAGRPRWILHDGPPYANGHIHMGTALN